MVKQSSVEEAIAQIPDGATLMVSGFGSPGTPFTLLDELVRQGQKHLTIIKNDANEDGVGISHLIEAGRVDHYITTHIGLNRRMIDRMNAGEINVTFHPQGIFAEKIRVAGAGSYGFLTDIGLETEITKADDLIQWQGKQYKLESALTADFALIHANCADELGNLTYKGSAMNFCPLMAMAADHCIAETRNLVAAGEIKPEAIHTQAAFVDELVLIENLGEPYQLMEHHL